MGLSQDRVLIYFGKTRSGFGKTRSGFGSCKQGIRIHVCIAYVYYLIRLSRVTEVGSGAGMVGACK